MARQLDIHPQPGPQEEFLASPADIAIFGGTLGCGKTWSLLLSSVLWVEPDEGRLGVDFEPGQYRGVLFRRTSPQFLRPGGLWDASKEIFADYGGESREKPQYEWRFPSGALLQMGHLEHPDAAMDWRGAELAFVGFDELTTFEEKQFWYMLSRNRSMSGVPPHMRATTNPLADSWVHRLIEWWIDPDTGFPIRERSGMIRWFVRDGDEIVWADRREDLAEWGVPPLSLTFVAASWRDNRILMEGDPLYEAKMKSGLASFERAQLVDGSWHVRPSSGDYFQRSMVADHMLNRAPDGLRMARGWDLAATKPRPGTDPDWTCGTLMGASRERRYCVADHVYDRLSPSGVEDMILATAQKDGTAVDIEIPQDPGQAGVSQKVALTRKLAGFNVRFRPVSSDKVARFKPFSAQCEAGNVDVVRGAWNDRWFRELENFPPPKRHGHDDDADSTSTAFDALLRRAPVASMSHYSFLASAKVRGAMRNFASRA